MGRDMLGVVMVMGLLLAMVPNTMQKSLIEDLEGPYIGLILSTASDETLLLDSGNYVTKTTIKKAGRTFNVGTFYGVPVVYVIALAPLAHVSVTIQILLDNFHIKGLIDYGNSASVSPSVDLADVAVLSKTAFASAWTWEEYGGISDSVEAKALPKLRFGEYNVPVEGDNELGSLQYEQIKKYTPKGANKDTFWYYIDPDWYNLASELKDIKLESCLEGSFCTQEVPSIVYGARGVSSDIYVQNVAYGKFLHKNLGVSTVDRKSAATVSTAVANGVKHIVFRAPSNKPGVPRDPKLGALASKNNLKVVSEFIKLLSSSEQPLKKY